MAYPLNGLMEDAALGLMAYPLTRLMGDTGGRDIEQSPWESYDGSD